MADGGYPGQAILAQLHGGTAPTPTDNGYPGQAIKAQLSGATPVAPTTAAKPASTGGGFFHDLLHSPVTLAEGAAGLGQAAYDLGKVIVKGDVGVVTGNQKAQQQASDTVGAYVKGIAKDYATRYAPLAHGNLGQFAHDVGHDPASYLLDAASLATLGGSGVAKAGQLLAKAKVIDDTSKLARLGTPVDLTVPNWRGEAVALRQSAANPVVRAPQVLANKGLNALANARGVVGEVGGKIQDARLLKNAAIPGERAAAGLKIDAMPHTQAFAVLSNPEKLAWHLAARGVHDPAAYRTFLLGQAGKTDLRSLTESGVSPAMLKELGNPKVAELLANPTPKLARALDTGRALSEQMTAEKVRQGLISETSAAESPYRLLRQISGATIHPENGIVGGKSIEQIATDLKNAGHEQPFYVPDSAVSSDTRGAGRYRSKPTGLAEPKRPGSARQNLGILAAKGLINPREDALSREMGLLANRTSGSMLHDAIVNHAAELPRNEPLPHGYDFIKLNHGEAAAPYTQRVAGEFEHSLAPGTADRVLTQDATDPNIATRNGNRLIVPSNVRHTLEGKVSSAHGVIRQLALDHPTSVWKHLVLGLRPGFFGNITVGNSILGTLQMAPGLHGVAGWLNQVVPGAEHVLGSKLTDATMRDVLPEQKLGTFGHSTGFTANRGKSIASKAYQGVMPATIAYENVLRRAMAEGWAKAQPEVQNLMRGGMDINQALKSVADTHPHVINEISKRIDDALGNYRTYNKLERAIKSVIPFYGWDRHIVRSVARIAKERPALLDGLSQVGQVGQQRQQQQLGNLPPYMKGQVRLPGLPSFLGPLNGRTATLNTQSLNPFNTVVDLARIPGSLVSNTPGSNEAVSGLNPVITAALEQLMTHRDMLTGAALKQNAFLQELENIPQIRTALAAAGKLPPTKPTSLYQNDARTLIANMLGVPVKKANLQTAHLYATQKPTRP